MYYSSCMAKRMKKSAMISKVAVDNHITRLNAEIVVAAVLEERKRCLEDGTPVTKGGMRTALRYQTLLTAKSVKNLSAFDALLG